MRRNDLIKAISQFVSVPLFIRLSSLVVGARPIDGLSFLEEYMCNGPAFFKPVYAWEERSTAVLWGKKKTAKYKGSRAI